MGPENLSDLSQWWRITEGTSWKYPQGPSKPRPKLWKKHPVVNVTLTDALAHCVWAGRDLPTEAEWEFAARGRIEHVVFPLGNSELVNNKLQAKYWHGQFPTQDSSKDRFRFTALVGSCPSNGWELSNMVGNAWQWTCDPATETADRPC